MYQKLNRVEQILFDAGALLLLLFYVFSAVIMPMATQYHRGIYTLVTYVLVFLLYRSIEVDANRGLSADAGFDGLYRLLDHEL